MSYNNICLAFSDIDTVLLQILLINGTIEIPTLNTATFHAWFQSIALFPTIKYNGQ